MQILPDLPELLAAVVAPDRLIIAISIHTHAALGVAVLAAGAGVYMQRANSCLHVTIPGATRRRRAHTRSGLSWLPLTRFPSIAGIHSGDAVESVETDLHGAHDIEGDDTSTVSITPRVGPQL